MAHIWDIVKVFFSINRLKLLIENLSLVGARLCRKPSWLRSGEIPVVSCHLLLTYE